MRDEFPYWESLTVRWNDQDPLGHVNNAKYFIYFEVARLGLFERLGVWSTDGQQREGPILARISCNFRRQLSYPAEVRIGTRVSRVGGKSFSLEQAIFTPGDPDPAADGDSVIVWFDYAEGRSLAVPDWMREKLQG